MPSATGLIKRQAEQLNQLLSIRLTRQGRLIRSTLPADFTAQVWTEAKKAGMRILARITWIDEELVKVQAEIETARADFLKACPDILSQEVVSGDIFRGLSEVPGDGGYKVVEPHPTGARYVNNVALAIRNKRVKPLEARRAALTREKTGLQIEARNYRKLMLLANDSDIRLIHFLSGELRNTFAFAGPFKIDFSKLTRVVLPSDAAGNALPDSALGSNGQPDINMGAQRASVEGDSVVL